MPKVGKSKKRKRESKKDEEHDAKKAKSKENDGPLEDQEQDCTNVSNLPYEEQQEMDDIDEKLEQNAAKNKLTTINVRSILHHVVSDKRVLAMVKSVAAELEDEQGDAAMSDNVENLDVELDFAPKMTRAKSKQTNQGDPIAVLACQSPIKELRTKRTSKKKIHFTELELPDSSSDEEYNPDNEEGESDEDTESCVSFTSDLASPHIPGTPEKEKTDDTKASEDNTEKTVTRSFSRKLSQEPFKVPYPVASTASTPAGEIAVVEKGDLIAKRTRSQLPLQDVPIESIEATFQPPDFTADMYDTIPDGDLDVEDIEWQKWLQGLINSDDVCGDEDHEDSEYNFMAEDQKEEREEYRNDRAVRITKKEVNALLDELLKDYDDSEDALWLDEESTDMGFLEMLNVSNAVDKKVQFFNAQQLERLTEQLQQHAQLLTQIFLMAREDDSLSKEAQLTRDYVNELQGFHDRASNAQLIRGLGDGMVHASAFSFPGLEQAVEIVNSTFVPKRRTSSPRKCTTPKKDSKQPVKRGRRSKTQTEDLPPLSETNIKLMASKKSVFRFVELLPRHSVLPRTGDTPKQLNGLRVKFSEAEDNLLALGMKQLGKKWDLIQEHLLPIKSPKQLQIRCKNLLSIRAPENIVKYYRRNKELWHLPTKIQVYIESNGRRVRVRESQEPDWLINYKKKQKERRASQEKSKPLVVQRSIVEGPSYNRPIAPKPSGGAYTVALPTGSSTSDPGQVAWMTVTSSANPWKALTPAQPVEDVCEQENTLVAGNVASVRSSPTVSVGQDTVKQTSEDQAPSPAPASVTDTDVDVNINASPANDEPVVPTHQTTEIETTMTPPDDSKPSSPNSNSKETSIENASKDSKEKVTSEGSNNKQTTSSKSKSSRDKNAGSATGGRVTSKSHNSGSESGGNAGGTSRKPAPNSQAGWTGNYILEPDPKFRNRAHAFAEGFLTKVKKQLSDDPGTYEEFLRTLALSSAEQCSPVELYRRVEVVLAQYPRLVEGFVGFLEPDQAVEAGVFMANLEFVRARTFLRKLEVHFQRSPSQFRKIINAFDSWNKKTVKDPLQLQKTVVPMLKGQVHLIEEFYSFFDDLKPPVCSDDDFEEIEFGSGSEPEVDDFEEVVIPCFVEPKKIKGRPAKDTLHKNTKAKKAKKPCATVKGTKQQGTTGKPLGSRTKVSQTKTNTFSKDQTKAGVKQDNLQGKSQGDNATKDITPTPEGSTNAETTREESGVSDQRTEVNSLEGPLSVTTSLQSETSNDSSREEELNPTNTDTLNLEHEEHEEERERRHSDSEEQEDDGNSDMEHDGYEEDDDDDYMDGDDIDGDVIKSDVDAEASGCDSDANVASSSAVVPAKNLQRSRDGQVVLLWTREDDRVILQACQKMGAKPETFEHIANGLKNKTADEVKTRFMDLLNLFKASSGERTRESTNEESCSEEEDEDDSETVGESEGEQPHD